MDDGQRRSLGEWKKRVTQLAPPKVPYPRGHPSYRFRRRVIQLVLDEIAVHGFRRRRNQANYDDPNKRPSGCSIVTTALNRLGVEMSEERLVDLIRLRRNRRGAN